MPENRAHLPEVSCLRCGRCCLEPFYRHVSPEDRAGWERGSRQDLLSAAAEEQRVLEEEDSFLALKKYRPCRFNQSEGLERTACVIYEARPRMCREFVPGKSRLCPAGK